MGFLSSARAASISLALVFAGGMAVGALGHRFYAMSTVEAVGTGGRPSPEEFRKRYLGELNSRCKLNKEQEQKINAVLDGTREKFKALNERQRPEVKAIQDAQTSSIRALLTDEQRIEYEKFREEREKARRERDAARK